MSCDICGGTSASRASSQTPFFFQNFLTRSVSFAYTGAQIHALALAASAPGAAFPACVKVAEIDLQCNAGLISVNMSSSITNYVAGSTCATYLALENGVVCDVNGMSRQFLSHMSGQNSIAGLPASTSRSTSIQMGQNSYYSVNSGQKIVIYASAPNDASTLLSGIATVFYITR
jgi:hypothetical protein